MNNLIGSIIELESGERGKAAIKLKEMRSLTTFKN